MDLELQKEMFTDHIASLKNYGDIKVLDFQKPGSNYYSVKPQTLPIIKTVMK